MDARLNTVAHLNTVANSDPGSGTPGWAGRLMEWLRFVMQLVLLNLLFLAGTLAGLVVFGAFPSAVAVTVLLARLRAGDPGDRLISDFVTAYRAAFVHANKVGSLFAFAGVLAILNVAALPGAAGGAQLALGTLAVVVSGALTVSAGAAVVICSRHRDSVLRTWRYALVLPLASPGMTAAWLVSMTAVGVLLAGINALLPLVGASLPLLVSGMLVGYRLDRLTQSPELDAAELDAAGNQLPSGRPRHHTA